MRHSRVSKQVTVVVPRTSWTFNKLPGESDEQAVNRFLYAILVEKEGPRRMVERVIKDAFHKEATEEVNAIWMDRYPQLVNDDSVKNLFQYSKRDE